MKSKFSVFHSYHDHLPAKTLWQGDSEEEGKTFFANTARIYGANTLLWNHAKDKAVSIKFAVTAGDIGKP